ncbi:MAG: hypothetical protein AB1635_01315 [Acidobacteriota bacterium]
MRLLVLAALAAFTGQLVPAPPAPPGPPPGPPSGPPSAGPYVHEIRSARSPDGLAWTHDGAVLLEHASVPSALVMPDGRVLVYYVDAAQMPETVNCAEATADGRLRPLGCTIAGRGGAKAVDPSVVLLPDGRVRLYYYASAQNVNAAGRHPIHAAVSDDGVHFVDEGEVYSDEGLVDPDVFWTGRDWLMFVFSLTRPGTIVAKSDDGRRFSYLGMHQLQGWGTTAPVRLEDGRFRLYAFNQGLQDTVRSFVSINALDWTMEDGIRLSAPPGLEITDPFVIRTRDGWWHMVYKVSPRPLSRRARVP